MRNFNASCTGFNSKQLRSSVFFAVPTAPKRQHDFRGRRSVTLRGCRQYWAAEVPVPGISSLAGSGIFERLELEPLRRKPDLSAVGQKQFSIGRDEVGHRTSFPD